MSRPEFPVGTVLTPEIISRIRSDQEFYDNNKDYCNRRDRQREEERREEEYHEQQFRDDLAKEE